MRAKAPASKTLATMALAQGKARSVARTAEVYEFPVENRPGRFLTQADFAKQVELDDLADLTWLVAEFQEPPDSRILTRQRWGRSQAERLREFAVKFLSAPVSESPAPRVIDDLMAKAKNLVECFIVRHQAISVPIRALKKLDWFPPKSTWDSPGQQPPGSWVEPITVADTLPAAFTLRVVDLLERRGDQIAACAEPSCRRLFVKLKHRKQEYCSAACSQKLRTAKMREQPDWLEKRRNIYHNRVDRQKNSAQPEAK